MSEESQILTPVWERITSVFPVLTEHRLICRAACRISEDILLRFMGFNLLTELWVVCLLLIGISYSSFQFFNAAKCNKNKYICTEWDSLYFQVVMKLLMSHFVCSVYLATANRKLMHQEKKSLEVCHLATSILLSGIFSGFWVWN